MSELPNIALTQSQQKVLDQLKDFIFKSKDRVFILKGYAGTGKTTLMRFLIKELVKENQLFRLLSTTGRAAKILSNYTKNEASTIHSMIYKFKDFNEDISKIDVKTPSADSTGQLFLVFEPTVLNTEDRDSVIYIVDEASMISDIAEKDIVQAQFGSGRVLKELIEYDKMPASKFIFIGDPCQLPPVQGTVSPALTTDYFSTTFKLKAQEGVLTEIMRQDNSIIAAGTYIRKQWDKAPELESAYPGKVWGPALHLSSFKDFVIHDQQTDMEREYLNIIKEKGYNDSIFICNSNAKCQEASFKIRTALGLSGCVQNKDLLMVIQNQNTTGLMNGDMVEVLDIRPESNRIIKTVQTPNGYHTTLEFREIKVKELFTQKEYTTLILENTLHPTNQVNLDAQQQSGLFLDFIIRMKRKGIDHKRDSEEFEKAMRIDPFLNALRCNYGYAVTCHKAQGGEWNSVFIQMPRNITFKPTKTKYQWFYTALTRAKLQVHLCKDFFIS